MADREAHLLAQIRATYDELDRWRALAADRQPPDRGSELADDDGDWPAWPVSEMARVGLVVAFDHLDAVRHTIETDRFFPFAQTTLIRAALIGAAQGVWLLAPATGAERNARNRSLVAYTYSQHGIYLRELLAVDPSHAGTSVVAAHVAIRAAELRERRNTLGERSKLEVTAMVRAAAEAVLLPHLRGDIMAVWRQSSGAAHGQPWAVLGTTDTAQASTVDAHGRAVFTATGGAVRIANSFLGVFQLAVQGWGLLGLRSAGASR